VQQVRGNSGSGGSSGSSIVAVVHQNGAAVSGSSRLQYCYYTCALLPLYILLVPASTTATTVLLQLLTPALLLNVTFHSASVYIGLHIRTIAYLADNVNSVGLHVALTIWSVTSMLIGSHRSSYLPPTRFIPSRTEPRPPRDIYTHNFQQQSPAIYYRCFTIHRPRKDMVYPVSSLRVRTCPS